MKKISGFIIVFLISACAFSQDTSATRPMGGGSDTSMNHHRMMNKMKDCIMMKDGVPMVMKGGQSMPLEQQMTLPNGTIVMTDGTVKMNNGTTKMLKSDECIYMDGTLGKMPMHDKMKMKMKKDSTMM